MSNEKKHDADSNPPSAVNRRALILGAGALGATTLVGGLGEAFAQQPAPKTPKGGHAPVQFSVHASELTVDGSNVTIKTPGLATTMARYGSADVRKELGEQKAKVKISPSEITIDAQGQVVISNAAFAKAINDYLSKPKAGFAGDFTNYCCSCNGSCLLSR